MTETMITVGLVAMILAVYAATLTGTIALRRLEYGTQAANFVQEELETLRSLNWGQLSNRTDGRFLGLPITRGAWQAATGNSPPSGTQTLTLTSPQTAVVEETGLAVLPGDYREDFTLSAKVNALAASPSGWGAGLVFRYRDAENHYRFRFSSGGIAFDKVENGAKTTLWSQSATYTTGTWYTLEVVAVGGSFTFKKNGVTLATVDDATFVTGDLAILALNSARVATDDVAVTENAVTSSWNFDATAAGTMPTDWQRLSYVDLPSGGGSVTIADYLAQTTIKQATVTVTWTDSAGPHSVSGSTLISRY